MSYWSDECLKAIGNGVGRYLDLVEPKGKQFSCTKICIEVDIEKGLPSEIVLTQEDWKNIQPLDYDQHFFKCERCHDYGNFSRDCKKSQARNGEGGNVTQEWHTQSRGANSGKGGAKNSRW